MVNGDGARPYRQVIRSIEVCVASAVAAELVLARVGFNPFAQSGAVFSNELNPNLLVNVTSKFSTAWVTPPQLGDVLCKTSLAGVVGQKEKWEFEDGSLILSPGQSLVVWNVGAAVGPLLDVTCIFTGC
jgi:hypothetical protein